MTIEQMIDTLVDKGYTREYAKTAAALDFAVLNNEDHDKHKFYECSVCRRWFDAVENRYHYHPCE